MKNSIQGWISAVKKLSIFPQSKVLCPDCEGSELRVFDIDLDQKSDCFERVMFCKSCKIHNSFSLEDKEKKMMDEPILSEEEVAVISKIKEAKRFAERASREI